MESGPGDNDLHPSRVNIYGWIVLHKNSEGVWQAATDSEHSGLPEHHEFIEVAQQQADYLREKGVTARIAGLIMEPKLDMRGAEDGEDQPNEE